VGTMENRGREKEQMQAVKRIHTVETGHKVESCKTSGWRPEELPVAVGL